MQRVFPAPVAICTNTSLPCSACSISSSCPGRNPGNLKYFWRDCGSFALAAHRALLSCLAKGQLVLVQTQPDTSVYTAVVQALRMQLRQSFEYATTWHAQANNQRINGTELICLPKYFYPASEIKLDLTFPLIVKLGSLDTRLNHRYIYQYNTTICHTLTSFLYVLILMLPASCESPIWRSTASGDAGACSRNLLIRFVVVALPSVAVKREKFAVPKPGQSALKSAINECGLLIACGYSCPQRSIKVTSYHVISVPRHSAFSSCKRKQAGTAGFEARIPYKRRLRITSKHAILLMVQLSKLMTKHYIKPSLSESQHTRVT